MPDDNLRSLSTVRVKRDDVLDKIKENRDNHRSVFEEALEGYRKAVIEALEKALDDAKNNKRFKPEIFLPEPRDHTRDYDRVISMLEMSQDDELELSQGEFSQYVLDDWGWKGDFIATTSNYTQHP